MPKVLFPKCFTKNRNNPAWIKSHVDLSTIEQSGGFFWTLLIFLHMPEPSTLPLTQGSPEAREHRCKCKVSALEITKKWTFCDKESVHFFQIYWPKEKSTYIWWSVGVSHCVSKWTTVVPKIFGRSSCHLCFVPSWTERRNLKFRSVDFNLFLSSSEFIFLLFFFVLPPTNSTEYPDPGLPKKH